MKAIINSVVRLIGVDEDEMIQIQQALTFRNPDYDSAARFGGRNMAFSDIPQFIKLYHVEHDGIVVPRGFDWRKYSPEVIDERVSNKVKWPEPKGKLIPAQQAAVEEMENYEEGCLVAPTASGKTRCGLYLAARLKQRILIVAHTNLIINAWREECKKVFGITPKIYSTRDPKPEGVVMLATVQSLSRGIPVEINKYFGMCLGDEIQHAPSPVWLTVLSALPAKYRYGITACVMGSTCLLTENGIPATIDSMVGKNKIIGSWSEEEGCTKDIASIYPVSWGDKYAVEITCTGNRVGKVTNDHPYLKIDENGNRTIIPAASLKKGDLVIGNPDWFFRGELNKVENFIVTEQDIINTFSEEEQKRVRKYKKLMLDLSNGVPILTLRKKYKTKYGSFGNMYAWKNGKEKPKAIHSIDTLKKFGLLPLKSNSWQASVIYQLLGFAYGDGHLTKQFRLVFVCTKTEADALCYWLRLLGSTPTIQKRKNSSAVTVEVNNFALARFFYVLGLNKGKKTKQKYLIPKFSKKDKHLALCFIDGLFSADGCISKRKKQGIGLLKKYYNMPSLTLNNEKKSNLVEFFKFIYTKLNEIHCVSTLKYRKLYTKKDINTPITMAVISVGLKTQWNFLQNFSFILSPDKKVRACEFIGEQAWRRGFLSVRNKIRNEVLKDFKRIKSISKVARRNNISISTAFSWKNGGNATQIRGVRENSFFKENEKIVEVTRVKKLKNYTDSSLFDVTTKETGWFDVSGVITHNTPTRKDKKHPMMFASIGPIRHKVREQDVLFDDGSRLTMPITAKTINSTFYFPLPSPPQRIPSTEYQAMLEAQMFDESRNKQIVKAVKEEYDAGNNCLILTLRRQHTKILTKMLRAVKVSAYRLTGQMDKEYQREVMEGAEQNKIRCIVGTLALIKEGTNCKRWNRLFLVSTVADRAMTEQIAGRIRRTHPEKKDAILYDVVDLRIPLLAHHFWKNRYPIYSRLSKG